MRKLLLSLATLLFGAGAWADVTDLPELSTADNPVYYVIHNTRSASGKFIYFDGNNETGTIKDNNPNVLSDKYMFYLTDAGNGKVKICNKATNLKLTTPNSWTAEGADCTIEVTPHSSKAGVAIRFAYTNQNNKDYLNEQNFDAGYTEWKADDDGSVFVFEKVKDAALPEVGKEYLIECPLFLKAKWVIKGLTVRESDSKPAWQNVSLSNTKDIWIVGTNDDGQISLKNKDTGTYLSNSTTNDNALSTDPVYGTISYLGSGQYNINIGDMTPMHAEGHSSGNGTSGNIVSWPAGLNTASAWKFVEASSEKEYLESHFINTDIVPVPVTTNDNDPQYFSIKSGRGDDKWYTYTPDDNKIALQALTGSDNQLWYFKGTISNSNVYLQLFPKNGEGKAMSYENTNNAADVITAQPLNTTGWFNTWKLLNVNGAAPYRLQTYDGSNYLSHHSNGSHKMGLWSGDPTTDTGTQIYIYTPELLYAELTSQISTSEAMIDGDGFGYYKSTEALQAALVNAKAIALTNTLPELFNAVTTLKTATNGLEQIVPIPGFYRIINNSGNACLVSGTSGRAKFAACNTYDLNSIESIFYYDGQKLVSYNNGLYFANGGNENGFLHYTDAVGNGLRIEFGCDYRMNGKCFVKFPKGTEANCGRSLYCANISGDASEVESNAGGSVDISTSDQNYRFTVAPVEYLPVMKPTDDKKYATLYSPVELNTAGRVEVFTADAVTNGDTKVSLVKQDVVPANKGVLLKYVDGAETAPNNGYVYLQVQGTTVTDVTSALKGSITDEYVTPENGTTCYILANPVVNGNAQGEAFYKVALNQLENTAFTNNGFKAYLPATNVANSRIIFDFGTETGIENIDGTEVDTTGNATIYDLSGRQVQKAQKGIYIVNGKKVIK